MVHPHDINNPMELCSGYLNCEGIYMQDIPVWFGQVFEWLIEGRIDAFTYLSAKSWLVVEGIIRIFTS